MNIKGWVVPLKPFHSNIESNTWRWVRETKEDGRKCESKKMEEELKVELKEERERESKGERERWDWECWAFSGGSWDFWFRKIYSCSHMEPERESWWFLWYNKFRKFGPVNALLWEGKGRDGPRGEKRSSMNHIFSSLLNLSCPQTAQILFPKNSSIIPPFLLKWLHEHSTAYCIKSSPFSLEF